MDITESVISHEPTIRLVCFLSVFGAIAVWEFMLPKRSLSYSRWVRWPNNLAVAVLNSVLVRVLLPTTVVGLADAAVAKNWGLLNQLSLPGWAEIIIAVLVLDFAIYLQHVLFHAVPALWRLHRMHHADQDFDVTTGARFHPIEIILSLGIKLIIVTALGPAVIAVIIFEVLLNGSSMFNHGNVRLAPKVDRVLRWMLVTPDMHRVHHSIVVQETNSNFGFNITWWDRLFGTYREQPAAGHDEMTIGIELFRSRREQMLDRMIVQPFRGPAGNAAINREEVTR